MGKNRTSNQGTGLDVQRLTPDNLLNIPRRNNILFLSDYLQEQHSFAKTYASDGLTMFSCWNHITSPAPKTTLAKASTALDEFLLGTPVLKARAPAPVIERSSTILKALDSTDGPAPVGEDHARPKRATGNPTRIKDKLPSAAQDDSIGGNMDKKNTSGLKEKPKENRKRTEDERGGSDDEHLKRLQDRRERKRLKKSIMKSPVKESENEKENFTRCTKKKGDKKDKTKSPTFALMHGFTATNVGKSRITLEPLLRNVGVFKKGKASCALKTGKLTIKKRGHHDVCFSETRFLGITKAKKIKNHFESSSGSSSSSGDTHEKRITMKHKEKPIVSKKRKETDEESIEDSNCSDPADRKEDYLHYDPADSITWDIERESHVESGAGCRQGSIVLSFPRDVLAHGGDKEKGQNAIVETSVVPADVSTCNRDATFIMTSGDSLHPSQSASQVVGERPKDQGTVNHGQLTFSKYFVPENITTTEADGHKDLFEGRQSITLPAHQDEISNKSMFPLSPPPIEAHLASPTLSQMISLDLVNGLPRSYEAFSLADVRSVFEGATMELDDYGPDVAFEPGIHSLQHYMLESPDFSIVSGNATDFEDPPVEDSCGECFSQNLLMGFAHEGCDGGALSGWNVDHGPGLFNADDTGYMTCEPGSGNDTFSRTAPSDVPNLSMPSVDGSGDDICVELSPNKIDRFSQGRSLLYGLDHGNTRVSDAEAEVAKLLKQNHWLPYRL